MRFPLFRSLLPGLLFFAASPVLAATIACHVTYGGQTQIVETVPTDTSYASPPIAIGSYYLFRTVFRALPADLASVKLYAYADLPDGRKLIHQASHPWPVNNAAQYGFTGQHFIYEPRYGAELQYWCEARK